MKCKTKYARTSPFIQDTPFNKTTFDVWDYLPEQDRTRIRARRHLVKDYQLNYENSLNHWQGNTYIDNNKNNIFDEGDRINYFVTIFTSCDAVLLESINRIIVPLEYEIIFLLENNQRDHVTAPSFFVRAGELVLANIKTTPGFLNLDLILDQIGRMAIPKDDLSRDILVQLIGSTGETGFGSYKSMTDTEEVLDFVKPINYGISHVAGAVATGVQWVIDKVELGKIDSDGWNYAIGEEDMSLFFFPFYKSHQPDEIPAEGDFNAAFDQIIKQFQETMKSSRYTLVTYNPIEMIPVLGSGGSMVTDGILEEITDDILLQADELFKELLADIKMIIDTGIEIGLVFINAFLCGFWNSILSLIQGVLFIVFLMAKTVELSSNMMAYPEKLDNFVQLIHDFDYAEAFRLVKTLFKKAFNYVFYEMSWIAILKEIRVAHVGYFLGALVEFILEIVAGAILFPGGGAIISVLSKGSKVIGGIVDIIKAIFRKSLNLKKGAKLDLSKITMEILKAGKKKMALAFDDMWIAIKKWLDNLPLLMNGFAQETIDFFWKRGIRIEAANQMPLASIFNSKVGKIYVLFDSNGRAIYSGTRKMVNQLKKQIEEMADDKVDDFIEGLAKREELFAKLGILTDGQNWYWKNTRGTKLKWSRLSKKRILENIEKQILDAADDGKKYEAEVARQLFKLAEKNGDEITDFSNDVINVVKNEINGEIDFATERYLFEIKSELHNSSSIEELANQLKKYLNINSKKDKFMNPLNKKVVVVYENLGTFSLNKGELKELADKGVIFINGIDNLKKLY